MRKWTPFFFIMGAAVMLLAPVLSRAASEEAAKVEQATAILNEVMAIPEEGIPEALLRDAYGVAVFPSVIKLGFLLGGRYGEGILVVGNRNGGWSNPAFIRLTGGSVGPQAGIQSTDTILVFRNRGSIDAITRGQFTLGVDASVAAGPVGRYASAGTDLLLRAEIFSYSRSRGAFVGAALDGAVLAMDYNANEGFYDQSAITPEAIFASGPRDAPPVATRFSCTLAYFTHTRMAVCG